MGFYKSLLTTFGKKDSNQPCLMCINVVARLQNAKNVEWNRESISFRYGRFV